MSYTLNIHCNGALSVLSFVGQLVHPLVFWLLLLLVLPLDGCIIVCLSDLFLLFLLLLLPLLLLLLLPSVTAFFTGNTI